MGRLEEGVMIILRSERFSSRVFGRGIPPNLRSQGLLNHVRRLYQRTARLRAWIKNCSTKNIIHQTTMVEESQPGLQTFCRRAGKGVAVGPCVLDQHGNWEELREDWLWWAGGATKRC